MNPEFQRQLWLQFSPTRLAVFPALMGLTLLATYLTAEDSIPMALAIAASMVFCISVFGMGTLAAGASVLDEINDRTWDQQRMSAMPPWAMTWGKLLGASSYGWYGGALAMLVAMPCALNTEVAPHVLTIAVVAIMLGLGLQSLLMSIHLHRVKVFGQGSQRGGAGVLALLMLWSIPALFRGIHQGPVSWWGWSFSTSVLALLSSALFLICAVCAAWRLMADVLAVRKMPWGLPALALVAAIYVAGFANEQRSLMLGVAGLIACAFATYGSLLAEPQWRTGWQKVLARWHAGDWRAALLQLPSWPGSLLLALLFALWNMAQSGSFAKGDELLDAMASKPLLLVLLMVRDCAVALFFGFSPKPRRAGLAFFLSLLVLHGLLPWLAHAAGGTAVLAWVHPLLGKGATAWVAALVHLAAAVAVLSWRWRQSPTA